ncbi:MAG: PDZ domain-containing protein [Ardenticatenaceae bacterium]|nr:PDZ domain-containing protein [Ardenticatenaceae bacterium]
MMKKQILPLVVVAVIWLLIGWFGRGFFLSEDIVLIERVRQGILTQYDGKPPSSRELTYGAIKGILARSGDPYAALLEPDAAQRYEADFAGESGVIGLFPEFADGKMIVSVVFPDEPAAVAGLQVGDEIVSLDGVLVDSETSLTEAALLIRGPVGEAVEFVVRRDGQLLTFRPVRQVRTIVAAEMLEDGIGYVAQYTFTTNAAEQLTQALQQLMAQQPRAIIWDLRSNGGGSMETAQAVLSQFVASGDLFYVSEKGDGRTTFPALGGGTAVSVPLVILIGERTYSAAETSALTVQESGRGTLIGGTTYGKGTVQATAPIAPDLLVQMTIGHWFSPQGRSIDGVGVVPDIAVTDDPDTEVDEVLQAAVAYIEENVAR